MAFQKHAHRYKRVKLGKNGFEVYKCYKPGCTHYIRKELVIGAIAECWRCRKEFVMTPMNAKQAKPHCNACTRTRKEAA